MTFILLFNVVIHSLFPGGGRGGGGGEDSYMKDTGMFVSFGRVNYGSCYHVGCLGGMSIFSAIIFSDE